MKKVLIAYASMAGSTAEIAEAVGRAMKQSGIEIDVRPIADVRNVESYDAVIVGAPMIVGWHREALSFVQTHQSTLSQVPVAYFITCVELTRTEADHVGTVPIYLDPELGHSPVNVDRLSVKEQRALPEGYLHAPLQNAPQIAPVSVGFFGGKIDFSKLKLLPRLFVKFIIRAEEGDWRNWDAITTWSEGLNQMLGVLA